MTIIGTSGSSESAPEYDVVPHGDLLRAEPLQNGQSADFLAVSQEPGASLLYTAGMDRARRRAVNIL